MMIRFQLKTPVFFLYRQLFTFLPTRRHQQEPTFGRLC